MARGQKQAADKQLALTNSVAGDERSRSNKLEDQLIPGYTSLMNTGYLSPEEEAAATTSEMGSATQPYESAGFKAASRAGATRNAADLTSEETQLARDEGISAGGAAEQLQREKMANQEAGMYGLGKLRGEDLDAMAKMYGLGPSTLGARAAGGGWAQGFKDFASGLSDLGVGMPG